MDEPPTKKEEGDTMDLAFWIAVLITSIPLVAAIWLLKVTKNL